MLFLKIGGFLDSGYCQEEENTLNVVRYLISGSYLLVLQLFAFLLFMVTAFLFMQNLKMR